MAEVKIVTDSTAYLPTGLADKYDIRTLPLSVFFGRASYAEGVDITNEEFYEKLTHSGVFPTTSQPSMASFLSTYEELTRKGHPILSLHISGKLSNTVESALAASRELPGAQIEVVDTNLTAMALGMVVLCAGEAAYEGRPLEEIKEYVQQLVQNVNLLFVVDTLEYLRKGGRIGGASALLGNILNIKPVLSLKEGRIEPVARVRTKQRALERLLELMDQRVPSRRPVHVSIIHAQALEEAVALEREVRQRFACREVLFSEIGPVLGAHVGPGTVGIAFYSESGPAMTPIHQPWKTDTVTVPGAAPASQELASRSNSQ